MTPTIYIYIPGILSIPGSDKNWCGKAVTWTHLHSDYRAEKVEYFSKVLTRNRRENQRSEKLSTMMAYYINHGWIINLVGHSNGCDVIMDSLKAQGYPDINNLHLISAACEADFNENGMNTAPVGSITVWIALKDRALALANTMIGQWLGYGSLGLSGAENATVPVTNIEADCHHNDWFKEENFDKTMGMIIKQ